MSKSDPAEAGIQGAREDARRARDLDDALQAALWAISIMEEQERAAEADAGFDAGEYSGPAHAEILDERLGALAERHGITREALDAAIDELAHGEPELPPASPCTSCGDLSLDGIKGEEGLCEECEAKINEARERWDRNQSTGGMLGITGPRP